MSGRSIVIGALVSVLGLAGAAQVPGDPPAPDGRILERRPAEYPGRCYEGDGRTLAAAFRYLGEVEASRITYGSDGLRISGFLVKPKAAGNHPCVIFNRGGNRDFGAIAGRALVNQLCRIASWGYVVVASQYRGQDQFGGQDLDDVLNLLPLLEAEPGADASRIGMIGFSRGGMMTCLALARTDRIRAAVVCSGLTDLLEMRRRPEMEQVFRDLVPGYAQGDPAPLVARSATLWPDRLCKRTPILVLHGSADWRVDPGSALRFAEALLKVRQPFRMVMFEGSGHLLPEQAAERDRLTREWLDRFVRDRAPLPDLEPHGD
jgi:dipeptidyl aminopeptidase/acylaminoacyl peptidase